MVIYQNHFSLKKKKKKKDLGPILRLLSQTGGGEGEGVGEGGRKGASLKLPGDCEHQSVWQL